MTADNSFIADQFSLLAKLMDIHGENSFKSKSYSSAAFTIEKLTEEIASLPEDKIFKIRGIGDSVGTCSPNFDVDCGPLHDLHIRAAVASQVNLDAQVLRLVSIIVFFKPIRVNEPGYIVEGILLQHRQESSFFLHARLEYFIVRCLIDRGFLSQCIS